MCGRNTSRSDIKDTSPLTSRVYLRRLRPNMPLRPCREADREKAGSVVNVVLIASAAVGVGAVHGLQDDR